jgi:hypothetical protein
VQNTIPVLDEDEELHEALEASRRDAEFERRMRDHYEHGGGSGGGGAEVE